MSLLLENQPVPLRSDADGVIRVAGTRVTLDTIVAAFRQGATAEQIAQDYSVVELADVYGVITYYLRHRAAVEAYLAQQRAEADTIRQSIESRFKPDGIRERLINRRARQDRSDAPADR
jgi:uncharacterized protein (DUF433 family)